MFFGLSVRFFVRLSVRSLY